MIKEMRNGYLLVGPATGMPYATVSARGLFIGAGWGVKGHVGVGT